MGRAVALPTITDDSALGGYEVQRSLRFVPGDTTYLLRTPSSSGNRRIWTFSCWVKRTEVGRGEYRSIFAGGGGSGVVDYFLFWNSDELCFTNFNSTNYDVRTTQKFRDVTNWFHLVLAVDSTQGTASNRVKIYVNGSQVTSFADSTYPSQNYDFEVNHTVTQLIGYNNYNYLDGYMTEVNFIDGLQLDASYFGFTEFQTGAWKPKGYYGSYGTNGFRLDFSDNSSVAALGHDKSGTGNHMTTVNNFSVSAGTGNDSVEDTPTNNFPTLNHLNSIKYNTDYDTHIEQGGLLMRGGDNVAPATFIFPKSGKWYCEFSKYGNGYSQGVSVVRADTDIRNLDGVTNHSSKATVTTYVELLVRGSAVSNNGTAWDNDADAVIGVAVDMDNGALYYAINNTWINSGVPTSGSAKTNAVVTDLLTVNNGDHYVAPQGFNGNDNSGMYANFGQQAFSYTPPTGYKKLCSKNLPKPTTPIINPDQHFEPLLYTGTGSSNIVEGLKFQPDMVWVKGRDTNGYEHMIIDSVRGGTKSLVPNSTDTESTHGGRSMTFYNRGVRWNSDSGNCNANGENYVLWCWKAGGSSNTYNIDETGYGTASAAGLDGGTIDPTGASINRENGFSVITYTANGSSGATIAHGLGKKPAWIIIKCRSAGDKWFIYHHRMDDTAPEDYLLELQETAQRVDTPNMLNDTAPTDTLITLSSDGAVNSGSRTYIMYSWAEIPGYSKFGSYVGNGNAEGPFVYCGFRPAFVLTKIYDGMNENWTISDSARSTFNPVDKFLRPDESTGDTSGAATMDFCAQGFKLRNTDDKTNRSDGKFIFVAFAEQSPVTQYDVFTNAR